MNLSLVWTASRIRRVSVLHLAKAIVRWKLFGENEKLLSLLLLAKTRANT